ncbi:MAG: inositol monophosphatase [Deltaproteobacteria bacterium]|nr:inositol monophosphatase [Deltaproteobacteria bacterium]
MVTAADLESEAFLRRFLLGRFPRDRFLGEEGGEHGGAAVRGRRRGGEPYLWAVDPLDGTVNFLHGHPFFAVSVALLDEGGPVVGAIEAPALGWSYAAARGRGARRNGRPIRVSAVASLDGALIGTGWPAASHVRPGPFLRPLGPVLRATQGARRCGSAAIDLALTADGTYDAHFERSLHTWDVAAGILLVREAGGRVTDHGGVEADASGREILASNGLIHGAMLGVLRGG